MEQANYKQLSEDFIEFLFRFNRNFFRQTSLPLPVNHFVTLVALFENPALTISELSQQLNIAKQQMTPIINKLLSSGYVSKQVYAEDRRCSNISLTEKGSELLAYHKTQHVQHFEKIVSVLSENESRDFTAALEKLNHMFGKIFPGRS
ncbi:MAG: MarR family winged helix-turn-helix transcriptional regulator [Selenomonadaceae bacterium]|jgi:DNA-binding MarR family transcriptional regulator